MIIAERAARVEAEAVAARAQALNTSTEVLLAHLTLEIEKLRRALYGSRSERKARLLEQMELQLEDLEAAATEDELAAEKAAARTQTVKSYDIDPLAWLADVLGRIADIPQSRLPELLPWNWKHSNLRVAA